MFGQWDDDHRHLKNLSLMTGYHLGLKEAGDRHTRLARSRPVCERGQWTSVGRGVPHKNWFICLRFISLRSAVPEMPW